ncbi:MAG: type II secretion system protein GspN [Deltaproteobacteria bacterium]
MKYLGYALFSIFAFLCALYLTFPWEDAKGRALAEVSRATGATITAKKLEPSWVTGVHAEGVKIQMPKSPDPIELAEIDARAHVLALISGGVGANVELPIAKGLVEADFSDGSSGTSVDATIAGVELALVPGAADAIGLPLSGTVDAKIDLELSKEDVKKSSGLIELKGSGLELLEGGKVSGFPVPALALGNLDWSVPVKNGKLLFEKQEMKGENVEVKLDGEITLNKDFSRSVLNLVVSFQPTDAFLKKEPLLGALLQNIRSAKGSDGFYSYAMTGSIKHPRFFPKRGGAKR